MYSNRCLGHRLQLRTTINPENSFCDAVGLQSILLESILLLLGDTILLGNTILLTSALQACSNGIRWVWRQLSLSQSLPEVQCGRWGQNTSVLKGAEGLNPAVVRVIVPRPAKLARLGHGTDGEPGLANRPVEEVPSSPVESIRVATVLANDTIPGLFVVLGPVAHVEIMFHALAFSTGLP